MEEENKKQSPKEIDKENADIINETVNQLARKMNYEEYKNLMKGIRKNRKRIYKLQKELGDNLPEAYESKQAKKLAELHEWNEKVAQNKLESIMPCLGNLNTMGQICENAIIKTDYPCEVFKRKLQKMCDEKKGVVFDRTVEGTAISRTDGYTFSEHFVNLIFNSGYINVERMNLLFNGDILIGRDQRILMDSEKVFDEMKKTEDETIKHINLMKVNEIMQYYEREIQFWEEKSLEYLEEDIKQYD